MTLQPPEVVVADEEPPPSTCQYCAAEATSVCPRCGTLYCAEHGGGACASCSRPETGLPSALLFRGVVLTLVAGGLLAFVLLVSRPRLPGEDAPAAGPAAPSAATAAPAGAAPPPGRTATPAPAPETYTVKPGDTFNAIAAGLGIDAEALRAANPGVDPVSLQIGQQLVIPARR